MAVVMSDRPRRSPARFLAPLALVGVLVVLFAVVSNGTGGDSGKNDKASTTESRKAPAAKTGDTGQSSTTTPRSSTPRTYVIKAGDTLGGIAAKTGVPLEQLQTLNPLLDPQAMTAGQRIKLRE
jgi:LysM repeat protein